MKKIFFFLLFLGSVFMHQTTLAQCLYGDCKNGVGRLKVDGKLYCGTFKGKKLNGLALVAVEDLSSGASVTYVNRARKPNWFALCIANFVNGEMASSGIFLFNFQIQDDQFGTDLTLYPEYYEGALTPQGLPTGYGKIYSEFVSQSIPGGGGKKILVADSILYENGVPKSASFYNSAFLTGTIEKPIFSINPNFFPINPKYSSSTRFLFQQIIKGKSTDYYGNHLGGIKKLSTAHKILTPHAMGIHIQYIDPLQVYTPDGTLVYEGEVTQSGEAKNPDLKIRKCVSGNCVNGTGKLVINMPIRVLSRISNDGTAQSVSNYYAVFEGNFVNQKPKGVFKMWSTCGYEFKGELNDDFSLKQGNVVMISQGATYEGSFGPESEAMGGSYNGAFFKGRITKERKYIPD